MVSRPEVVCRKQDSSLEWEVVLAVNETAHIEDVRQNGEHLRMTNGEYRLPSLRDHLTISYANGDTKDIALYDGKPLIFKLQKNWTGDGHKVGGITNGYFIVIAPDDWKRTGRVPVESDGCSDSHFMAHYFFRHTGGSSEEIGSFRECDVELGATGYELVGERLFDDSDDGELFVGAIPSLQTPKHIAWVRVGAEEENGWRGENFEPDKHSLSETLNDRQGRFFVRVYDAEAKLLDSGEFRYLRALKEISVNGEPYTERTILKLSPTGYGSTKVRFKGVDGANVRLSLPPGFQHASVQGNDLIVKSLPKADRVECTLESDTGRVNVAICMRRVWWRMEGAGIESDDWRATPYDMTREEFRDGAYADATMRLRLPQRIKSVRVGFDDELERMYRRKESENDILIRLDDFVDYSQIDEPLRKDASVNVDCGGSGADAHPDFSGSRS